MARTASSVAAMATVVAHLKTEVATFCGPAAEALFIAQQKLEDHAKSLWLAEEMRRVAL